MATPLIEISHAGTAEGTKVSGMKVIVRSLPLFCDGFGRVASKIVKSTKLLANGSTIEFVPCRIPFHTALPVVVVSVPVLSALTHDTLGIHSRTGTKSIRKVFHSI